MWIAPIVSLFALGVWVPPESATAPPVDVPATQAIATRQTVFTIPFNIPAAQPGAPQPIEVQLSVSRDGGLTWQPSGRARPDQPGFMFRAPGDGPYAFAIQTLLRNPDGSTQLQPPGPPTAGLSVVVDTRPPVLTLEAFQGEAGQITARWQVDEPNPQPGGISLQFRMGPAGNWQPIAVPQQPQRNPDGTLFGEVTWWPPAPSGTVEIRAELADRAGNPAVTHAQVVLNQNPVTMPTPAGPSLGLPPAINPGPAPGAPAPTHGWPPQDQASAGLATEDPSWRGAAPGPTAAEWPPYETQGHPLAGQQPGMQAPMGPNHTMYPGPALGPGPAAPPINRSVAAEVNPPLQSEYVAPPVHSPPAADRPRMVNSRLFELEYDVASVGPSGIARVELWATRNGGRTWESLTLDDDNQSPLLVKVDEEGLYGFKVAITSGAGLGGQVPRPGDKPDVMIHVDLTLPTARILSADQGIDAEAGHLIVSWDAADAMLAPRPITLLFGESPGGPWIPIATDIENTGRYAWPMRSTLPPETYFRLEVLDEAGNMAVHETSQSVALDRSRPAGRIRDVRPVGPTAGHGPRRYRFR